MNRWEEAADSLTPTFRPCGLQRFLDSIEDADALLAVLRAQTQWMDCVRIIEAGGGPALHPQTVRDHMNGAHKLCRTAG